MDRNRRLTLSVTEAAELLGISRALAYELVARGELPSLQFGRRLVVPWRAIERLLASCEDTAGDRNRRKAERAAVHRPRPTHPDHRSQPTNQRPNTITPQPPNGARRTQRQNDRPPPRTLTSRTRLTHWHQGCAGAVSAVGMGGDVVDRELRPGQEHYYLEAATKGIDEYYTVRGEIAGRWVGEGAGSSGWAGGSSPTSCGRFSTATIRARDGTLASRTRRVPGFDACFSAPKSVSMLFAVGEDNIGAQVFAAHDAAVVAALGYLERHALFVRRGHAGTRRVRAQGLIGAAFRHRTSRAGDPQLHTHVLIANLTLGTDGRWGTLDSRCLFRHARSAGFVYQAHLRHELSRRLGVRWGPVRQGCAEIEGVPATVLRAFSRRRDQITKQLEVRGQSSAAAAQVATLATRSPKDYDEDHRALRAEWIARAAGLDFEAADVAACLGLEPEPVLEPPDHAEVAAELTAEQSTFLARDVVRVFAGHAQAGAPRRGDRELDEPVPRQRARHPAH